MPGGLVLKLPPHLTKVAITDRLGELMVFEHTRYMQVLDRYQGVVFAEVGGELVGCILADIRYTGMLFCQLLASLLAVLAAQLTAGIFSLYTRGVPFSQLYVTR